MTDSENPPAAAGAPRQGETDADLDVRILRGSPTDEELAAILAVLHTLPALPAHRPAPAPPAPTGWQLSQRSLRSPLRDRWR